MEKYLKPNPTRVLGHALGRALGRLVLTQGPQHTNATAAALSVNSATNVSSGETKVETPALASRFSRLNSTGSNDNVIPVSPEVEGKLNDHAQLEFNIFAQQIPKCLLTALMKKIDLASVHPDWGINKEYSRNTVKQMKGWLIDHYKKIHKDAQSSILREPGLSAQYARTMRKRKREEKPPHTSSSSDAKKKKRASRVTATELVIKLGKNEGYSLSTKQGHLFCNHCSKCIAKKGQIFTQHVKDHHKSQRHKKNVVKNKENEGTLNQDTVYSYLKTASSMASVSRETMNFRFHVLRAFLKAGTPLSSIDVVRPVLEVYAGHSLTHSTNLSKLITDVVALELKQTQDELKNSLVSLCFDGTSNIDEVTAVITRSIIQPTSASGTPKVVQRLIGLPVTTASLHGAQLANVLLHSLLKMGFDGKEVFACMADRCHVNDACFTVLQEHLKMFQNCFRMPCFSHTINNAGKRLFEETLTQSFVFLRLFWNRFQKITKNSRTAKDEFKRVTGESLLSYSNTRWWSKYDCLAQISNVFDKLLLWIDGIKEKVIKPDSALKLYAMLLDDSNLHFLKVELAAYIFLGKKLRRATYLLEGNSQLAFITFNVVKTVLDELKNGISNIPAVAEVSKAAVKWATTTEGHSAIKIAEEEMKIAKAHYDALQDSNIVRRRGRSSRNTEPVSGLTPAQEKAALLRRAKEKLEKKKEEDHLAKILAAKEEMLLAKKAASPPMTEQEWMKYAIDQIESGVNYFIEKFDTGGPCNNALSVFEAASIYHPDTGGSKMSLEDAEKLVKHFALLPSYKDDETKIEQLSAELGEVKFIVQDYQRALRPGNKCKVDAPGYLFNRRDAKIVQMHERENIPYSYTVKYVGETKETKVSSDMVHRVPVDVLSIFYRKKILVPHTYALIEKLVLLQPSSGSAERVFSLLQAFFASNGRRASSLMDLKLATLMLRYHDRDLRPPKLRS
eukprot:g5521.t1